MIMGDFDFGFINQNRSISSNGNQQLQNGTLLSNNKYRGNYKNILNNLNVTPRRMR